MRWGRGVAREQLPTTNCYPGEETRAPGHGGSERLQEKGNLKPSDLRSVQVATIGPTRAVSAEPARREGRRPRALFTPEGGRWRRASRAAGRAPRRAQVWGSAVGSPFPAAPLTRPRTLAASGMPAAFEAHSLDYLI